MLAEIDPSTGPLMRFKVHQRELPSLPLGAFTNCLENTRRSSDGIAGI